MSSKKLERSVKDRIIAGVIGGLSDYLNIDVNLLRIVAVLLFLVSPVLMLILYVVAVFFVPRTGEEKPLASSFELDKYLPLLVGLVLMIIGAGLLGSVAVVSIFWLFTPYGFSAIMRLIIGAVLVIIGAAISIPQLRNL
ncbi:MAG: PspC domain-containing protein [Nitrososphaerota archaeon]